MTYRFDNLLMSKENAKFFILNGQVVCLCAKLFKYIFPISPRNTFYPQHLSIELDESFPSSCS